MRLCPTPIPASLGAVKGWTHPQLPPPPYEHSIRTRVKMCPAKHVALYANLKHGLKEREKYSLQLERFVWGVGVRYVCMCVCMYMHGMSTLSWKRVYFLCRLYVQPEAFKIILVSKEQKCF